MEILETKNLHKVFRETDVPIKAVNGIDLKISKGEFTAIVGPSGSGKTTLMNMIGGLDQPTKGVIVVDGKEITNSKPSKLIDFRLHNIGFIFQAYNLIPVLTAIENVEFIMNLQNRGKKESQERAMEMLKAVGLGDRADSRPGKLSGGQQQRVAVARALASKPKFVLADEPTANLDSKSTENLMEIMEKLNEREDTTFIFSTHDQRVVKRARRIITIEDGSIINDETRK
jgi:putative ABC transport system ATP-binding protein